MIYVSLPVSTVHRGCLFNCAESCHLQELGRFNSLLSVMRSTLLALDQACKGLALMRAELDALGRSLFDCKVRSTWYLQ
jgi:dynein heavy chain